MRWLVAILSGGIALVPLWAAAPPMPQKGMPALLYQLRDPEPITRAWAARELGNRGLAGKPAVPALALALRDREPTVAKAGGPGAGPDWPAGHRRADQGVALA